MKSQGHLKRHSGLVGALVRTIDAVIIAGTLASCYVLFDDQPHHVDDYVVAGLLAAFAFQLFSEFTALYRSYRGEPLRRETMAIAKTWALSMAVVLAAGFASKHSTIYSRILVTAWAATVPLILWCIRALGRALLSTIRSVGLNYRTAAIMGLGEQGVQLAGHIHANPSLGIQMRGIYCDEEPEQGMPDYARRVGTVADGVALARAGELDAIYLALPTHRMAQSDEIISQLADSTVNLYVVPQFETYHLFQSPVTMIGDIPALSVFDTPMKGVDGMFKRVEDVILAAACLLVLAVPMLAIAAAVRLSSPGPVLFRQRRYGIGGQEIWVWKFRSMRVCEDGGVVQQATKGDPRVTSVGAFLRRTSLDELPQLFNVIQGRMSMVGPRPHAVAHNEEYRKLIHGYMLRHKVKPGITGLAQVRGFRGETDTLEKMQKRVECDLEYIRTWSLALDLRILAATCFSFLGQKNAY